MGRGGPALTYKRLFSDSKQDNTCIKKFKIRACCVSCSSLLNVKVYIAFVKCVRQEEILVSAKRSTTSPQLSKKNLRPLHTENETPACSVANDFLESGLLFSIPDSPWYTCGTKILVKNRLIKK